MEIHIMKYEKFAPPVNSIIKKVGPEKKAWEQRVVLSKLPTGKKLHCRFQPVENSTCSNMLQNFNILLVIKTQKRMANQESYAQLVE